MHYLCNKNINIACKNIACLFTKLQEYTIYSKIKYLKLRIEILTTGQVFLHRIELLTPNKAFNYEKSIFNLKKSF